MNAADYVAALKIELADVRDSAHAAEIRAELKRFGALDESVENAAAPVAKRQTARAPKTSKPKE